MLEFPTVSGPPAVWHTRSRCLFGSGATATDSVVLLQCTITVYYSRRQVCKQQIHQVFHHAVSGAFACWAVSALLGVHRTAKIADILMESHNVRAVRTRSGTVTQCRPELAMSPLCKHGIVTCPTGGAHWGTHDHRAFQC
jgi:hypothetical protein